MTESNLRKTTVVKSKLYITAILLSLAYSCLSASAQFENLLKETAGMMAAAGAETPNLQEQLQKWKSETERELESLKSFEADAPLPDGVTSANISTYHRILERTLLEISNHFLILDEVKESKSALEAEKAAAAEWKGYETKPPYSLLMVDELIEKSEAIEGKRASNRSSIEIYKNSLADILKDAKETEKAIACVLKEHLKAPSTQWMLNISKAKRRSLFIRASSLQHSIASLELKIETDSSELALLSRKINVASNQLTFSKEDIARIEEASSDRMSALQKDVSDVSKRQRKAAKEKDAATATLLKLKEGGAPAPMALELAELNLETALTQVEALQSISYFLDAFNEIESFIPEAYKNRLILRNSTKPEERHAPIEALVSLLTQLESWDIVAKNELESVTADIGKQESRVSLLPDDDDRLDPLAQQLKVLWEKKTVIQRAVQSITNQRRTISRWISDFQAKEHNPWYSIITDTLARVWSYSERIWNIPVNKYQETIEVDGQKIVEFRFVSLGSVFLALILFFIAYYITSKISQRVQTVLVHRGHIGENQARTLRTWIMLFVALILALATLNWLSIPLTIFAFLAGALAIGVGFGTQTMIKNFISGIILLVERKVRVGDIIVVDGIKGVVSEINTRSSIVTGFNGIENLIPNSLFLENRVVNWTLNNSLLRRELKLSVPYGTDIHTIIDILKEAADRHNLVLNNPKPIALFSNFADNSLDFTLLFWIELNDTTPGIVIDSDLRIMLGKKLADLGITVPFPQRDIHLSTAQPLQVQITETRKEAAPQDTEKSDEA